MEEVVTRQKEETFDDFFVRLFQNKEKYNLSCQEIADILNKEQGVDFGESKWRKEYAAFSRGMAYVKNKTKREVANRILCISDLHIPFNLPITTFSAYKDGVIDTLVINGDLSDCQAISKFPKSYRISPMEEIITARSYLIDLINYICPSKVVINYGNHDTRFQNYLAKSIDSDLNELMPKTPIDLIVSDGFYHYNKRSGTKTYYCPITEIFTDIDVNYTNNWFCQIGNTIFCHPIAYASGILKTAEKAMLFFRNEGYNFNALVMGHTHKVGSYKIGNTTIYEQGCCCDTNKQHYADGKLTMSQKEGYLYVCHDKNGDILKDYSKIIELN